MTEAQWIGGRELPPEEQPENGNPAIYLRKTFEVKEKSPARVRYAGLGLSVVYLNGRRVGDAVLQCAFTDYRKRVLEAEEDVTGYLREGENELLVVLGDGWYNQTTRDEWGFFRAEWRAERKLLLTLTAGREKVVTDGSWKVSAEGEIVRSALRLGETRDCRRKIDWDRAENAVVLPAPAGKLCLADFPPVRECETLDFASCTAYPGGYLLDFGKNIAGYVRIRAKEGRIKVRHGDRLTEGRIDNASNAQYIYNKSFEYQTDTYILDGEERELNPEFAYHGFQYAEVEGLTRAPERGRVQAVSVHTDFRRIGKFRCSDERLNRLYEMSAASAEANFVGIPTDCPHREKNGWTGDMQLSAEMYLLTYACEKNLLKWLEDIADSQEPSGRIPCIAPTSGWGYDWGNGPAWDYALFELPDQLERYRGIPNRYRAVWEKYYGYLESRERDGLVKVGLGDWNYPKETEVEVAPTELTDSCYYAKMGRMLGKDVRKTEKAIREKYGEARGMGALACLCYFGIAEKFEELLAEIERQEYRYKAGILGVKYVNRTLTERGRTDVLLRLLRAEGYPSFLNWSERGGTALWEDFEGKNSRCHHMYGDIAAELVRGVGGIRVKGPAEVEIRPDAAGLEWFEAETELPGGKVSVAYKNGGYSVLAPETVRVL